MRVAGPGILKREGPACVFAADQEAATTYASATATGSDSGAADGVAWLVARWLAHGRELAAVASERMLSRRHCVVGIGPCLNVKPSRPRASWSEGPAATCTVKDAHVTPRDPKEP